MSSPTLGQILQHLQNLGSQLDDATGELDDLSVTAVRARNGYEKAYAKAFLTADGPVEMKKQQALLATAERRLDAQLAEVGVEACKERIRSLRARIEIGRSLNAAQRTEASLAGYGS